MLDTIHLLLTYKCSLRCDHCYVYGSPRARGTFNLPQVSKLLAEAAKVGKVEWIYFDGGEPFLVYPLLLQSIRKARNYGFKVGVVTNGYFARTEETAIHFLEPLRQMGVASLQVSDDAYHYRSSGETPAKRALRAANKIGLPATRLSIVPPDQPYTYRESELNRQDKCGYPEDNRLRYRGRAVEKLTAGVPTTGWETLNCCAYEELSDPWRVYVDSLGNVQICQGLSIGNARQTPLATLLDCYQAEKHPIYGPILLGGPSFLAERYGIEPDGRYVDACHLCFTVRLDLIDRFPGYLGPLHIYGLGKN
jgi:organic radical activating enzyme